VCTIQRPPPWGCARRALMREPVSYSPGWREPRGAKASGTDAAVGGADAAAMRGDPPSPAGRPRRAPRSHPSDRHKQL
jgi:hypothetical protein